jgi:hypothetical protein
VSIFFHLKNNYYSELINDPEFENNPSRNYIIVPKIKYKGRIINVAIPLRSNININFQKRKGEIIPTVPTPKTRPGNIAGFHILKIIPVNRATVVRYDYDMQARRDLALAEQIVKQSEDVLKQYIISFLSCLEKNEKTWAAIDFDNALQIADTLKAQSQAAFNKNKK